MMMMTKIVITYDHEYDECDDDFDMGMKNLQSQRSSKVLSGFLRSSRSTLDYPFLT